MIGLARAVTVSTPDHTHAVAAMMAMKLGKHVRIQKPLARTLWEVRQLEEAARRYKVATQMGNQGHSSSSRRLLVEALDLAVFVNDEREVRLAPPEGPQLIGERAHVRHEPRLARDLHDVDALRTAAAAQRSSISPPGAPSSCEIKHTSPPRNTIASASSTTGSSSSCAAFPIRTRSSSS